MLDKTITSALCRLRVKIIRDGLEGLPHVEALLTLRGVRLTKVPRKTPHDRQQQRGISLMVRTALQSGPQTTCGIGDTIMAARPGLGRMSVMVRVYRAIYKLRDKGLVRREGRLWGLMPPSASSPSTRG